jgi:hypothetical protein
MARHLGSVLAPDDELLLGLFAGGSPEPIRAAGVPVERVVGIVGPPSRGQQVGKHPMHRRAGAATMPRDERRMEDGLCRTFSVKTGCGRGLK